MIFFFLPDADTGQNETRGEDKRRHRSANSRRAVERGGRGPKEMGLRGRAESENDTEKWAGKPRPRGGWGVRGADRSTEGRRDVGRKPWEATARGGVRWGSKSINREGAGWRNAEVRMERSGRGDQNYEKCDVGNRNPQSRVGRPLSTSGARPAQGPGLGYKKLEELSKQEPSLVAISLSNHPALDEVLKETKPRKDLIELLCLVLSNAFRSRADRATLQHLAGIIKGSNFLRIVLLYYLADVESEHNCNRRMQYQEHLANILVILSEVNRRSE